jgi:hypothetical protein
MIVLLTALKGYVDLDFKYSTGMGGGVHHKSWYVSEEAMGMS